MVEHNRHNGPVFIIGYPRSGTTLLRALLGAHSEIELVNEPGLIRGLRTAGHNVNDVFPRETLPTLLEQLRKVGPSRRHLQALSSETLREFIYTRRRTFKQVYELLLPKPKGYVVWGEKSVGNIFYIRELHQLYPDAVFVHIIRDPRAALLSHYRKRYAGCADALPPFDVDSIRFFVHGALLWNQWYNAAERASRSLGGRIVLQVGYRELVTNPEKQLTDICRAVGLKFEPDMLDSANRQHDPVLIPKNGTAYAHRNLAQPIKPERANSFDELPAWAAFIVEKYVGHRLAALGFAPSKHKPGTVEKIRVGLEMLIAERKIYSNVLKDVAIRHGLTKPTPPTSLRKTA